MPRFILIWDAVDTIEDLVDEVKEVKKTFWRGSRGRATFRGLVHWQQGRLGLLKTHLSITSFATHQAWKRLRFSVSQLCSNEWSKDFFSLLWNLVVVWQDFLCSDWKWMRLLEQNNSKWSLMALSHLSIIGANHLTPKKSCLSIIYMVSWSNVAFLYSVEVKAYLAMTLLLKAPIHLTFSLSNVALLYLVEVMTPPIIVEVKARRSIDTSPCSCTSNYWSNAIF